MMLQSHSWAYIQKKQKKKTKNKKNMVWKDIFTIMFITALHNIHYNSQDKQAT